MNTTQLPPEVPTRNMVSTPATCDRCGAKIHRPGDDPVAEQCPYCPEGKLAPDLWTPVPTCPVHRVAMSIGPSGDRWMCPLGDHTAKR